jgi:copper transport protein
MRKASRWRFLIAVATFAASTAGAQAPLAIHIHGDNAMFQVLVSPGKVGTDSFVLQLMAGDASPLPAKEAILTLSLPERGIEPVERRAVRGADGYWSVHDVPIPYSGRWHLRVEALMGDSTKVTLEDEFEVPAR